MLNTFTRFRIILTNAVKYVTNVESYSSAGRSFFGHALSGKQAGAEF